MGKTVALASLGCSKNLVDAENMLGILQNKGYTILENESEAEVLIVNTCCFIEDAKKESIDTILELADNKKIGKCKKLIVTGCMAERYKEQILEQMPEVDVVVGIGGVGDIIEAVEGEGLVSCDKPYSFVDVSRKRTTPSYMAYLKIADGCDNRCTYCVIPSIRGKYQSRPIEELVAEAKTLAAEGVKELIIIAQDTTNYGADLYGEPRLAQLLTELCKIEGFVWIRLHYCYPERITDELIEIIAKEDKICKYLDIPIQHCSDGILKKMGRKGSKAEIVNLINKLRAKIPNITIRTTLIAGFPTETEEEYTELENFVKEMEFDRLGVFAYSMEEETPAYNMEGQIDEDEKQKRAEMLTFIQSDIAEKQSKALIGKTLKVLVEGFDPIIKQHFGRTEMDSVDIDGKVFFRSSEKIPEGEFVNVSISDSIDYDLFGEVVL